MTTKSKALTEFREKHIGEMENNINVWISIRDNIENSPKDRIEAAKNIARALHALQPDKVQEKKDTGKKIAPLTESQEKDIQEQVDKILNA